MKKIDTKLAFDKFKPESCVFVISRSLNGKNNGMIAGFNMKCSADPYMFAVSLWKKGYTHKLIRESKEFVIAVPNKDLEKEIRVFGKNHGNNFDKFKKTNLKTRKGKFVNSFLLEDATINFECKLINEIDVGDHILFIGEVLASYVNEDKKILLNMGKNKDGNYFFLEF